MVSWQDISCFKVKCLILFLISISFSHTALSQDKVEKPANALVISIPFSENKLARNDPYFVALKLAFKHLAIDVKFVVLPGARSLKMLHKGNIAGNYPRFSDIADANSSIVKLTYFNTLHKLYAFSLDKSNQGKLFNMPDNPSASVGIVRGIKVLEDKYNDVNIHWFSHIDHLIGALEIGRVKYILEREGVVLPFENESLVFYRSKNAVFVGKLTLVLHEDYKDIAVQLDKYFISNPVKATLVATELVEYLSVEN